MNSGQVKRLAYSLGSQLCGIAGIALDLCIGLEENGIGAVPVPTNESEWDGRTGRWRSIRLK